jgi:tRNA-splicing ligase RtcB
MPEHLNGKKLINWASILEDNTRDQAIMASEMPFIFPHIALMPDAHLGKGATVGSVIPTRGAIIPAAVGVDIGCGMIAVRTQFRGEHLKGMDLSKLRERIEGAIPLSAGKYNWKVYGQHTLDRIKLLDNKSSINDLDLKDYFADNWEMQLGTLGSGNHFIEVSLDENDNVWLFLHSGSRGVGNRIAQHHIKVAQELCERWFIDLPDKDLAYLVEGTKEFSNYISDLRWAQDFALLNREEMMDRVVDQFERWWDVETGNDDRGDGYRKIERLEEINCHHNYTTQENHFGKNVWLSRKGAIDASKGKMGLIPGSMGTRSYVVEGLGNPVSLNSSPHGAGREYSRSRAKKTFTNDDLVTAMVGIEYRKTDAFIDEIPQAYKDIDVIMEDAKDLVKPVHTLRQIVNVKGD